MYNVVSLVYMYVSKFHQIYCHQIRGRPADRYAVCNIKCVLL